MLRYGGGTRRVAGAGELGNAVWTYETLHDAVAAIGRG